MKYSTTNLTLSLYRQLAEFLRAEGYGVLWHATGESEARTAGADLGTLTLVPEFPANPTQIVRLTSGSLAEDEVAIPALSLSVLGSPRKHRRTGLGEATFERHRGIRVDGFARDSFEHRDLADRLYDWLGATDVRLPVWDYAADGNNPPALEPADVVNVTIERHELTDGDEAHRYYLNLIATLSYFE